MKVLVLMTVISLLGACSGNRAVRVDCERRLVPINVPGTVASESAAETAPARGQRP